MNRRYRAERGQSLVIAILSMAVLAGMVALAVDIGLAYEERRQYQNAVDAAALAGATELPFNPGMAIQKARDWAVKNGIDENKEKLSVEITQTFVPVDTIEVKVEGDSPALFARILGLVGFDLTADARARIGSPAELDLFVPLAVQDNVLSGLAPGDPAIIKYNAQDQTQGNSLALAFPGSSGANDFRANIMNGSPQLFCTVGNEYEGCPSAIWTEPGAVAGPIRQGLNDRFGATSTNCDTYSEVFQQDASNPGNVRMTPACNPFPPYSVTDSKRVVIIPVIDQLCAGHCEVHIIRFALFFVEGFNCNQGIGSCEVVGRYAEASLDPGALHQAPYDPDAALKIIRLIK